MGNLAQLLTTINLLPERQPPLGMLLSTIGSIRPSFWLAHCYPVVPALPKLVGMNGKKGEDRPAWAQETRPGRSKTVKMGEYWTLLINRSPPIC